MINYDSIKKLKSEKIWFFRFKKFDENRYLITNDIWYFCFLLNADFLNFITWKLNKISKEKHDELSRKLFIKNEWFKKENAVGFKQKSSFLQYWPSLHIIVLTLRCNHACKYCHAYVSNEKAQGKDMTVEIARKVVDTIFYTTSNQITIEFQWWEPLLNFDVLKFIVEYAKLKAHHLKKDLNFALVSNMSLMTEEKFQYILENNIWLSTSLDWDEETHNFNRTFNKGNSYEKVTYWIKRINDEYKKRGMQNRIGALTTVTRKTLPKYKELIDTYVGLWLNSIFLRPLNPYWFASKNMDTLWYSPEEFNEFYNNCLKYIYELHGKWIYLRESLTTIYLQKVLKNTDPNFLDERSPCWATIWQVAYNYNGNIYTCDEGRMFSEMWDESFYVWSIEKDEKTNYVNMIDNDTTKTMIKASITDSLPGYNDSVYKVYIWVCPVHNYKHHGNVFPNYSLDNRIKISYNVLDNIFKNIENPKYFDIYKNWVWQGDDNKNCF